MHNQRQLPLQRTHKCHPQSAVFSHCNAGNSENLHPLILSKFHKPYSLKNFRHYMCHHTSTCKINQWMAGPFLISKWLPRTRIFSANGSVCCPQQGHCPETCAHLLPTANLHQIHEATGPWHCKLYKVSVTKVRTTFFVARNRLQCSYKRYKDVEHLGCHVRSFCGMEIHHNCHNTELPCKMWLQHRKVNTSNEDKNCEMEELQGHINCPHIFGKFLNINKCVPTLGDQPTSLDSRDPSSVHMIGEEEEKTE